MLQGRLTYRTWDKEGQTIKTAEIHLDRFESRMELLDAKGEQNPQNPLTLKWRSLTSLIKTKRIFHSND